MNNPLSLFHRRLWPRSSERRNSLPKTPAEEDGAGICDDDDDEDATSSSPSFFRAAAAEAEPGPSPRSSKEPLETPAEDNVEAAAARWGGGGGGGREGGLKAPKSELSTSSREGEAAAGPGVGAAAVAVPPLSPLSKASGEGLVRCVSLLVLSLARLLARWLYIARRHKESARCARVLAASSLGSVRRQS